MRRGREGSLFPPLFSSLSSSLSIFCSPSHSPTIIHSLLSKVKRILNNPNITRLYHHRFVPYEPRVGFCFQSCTRGTYYSETHRTCFLSLPAITFFSLFFGHWAPEIVDLVVRTSDDSSSSWHVSCSLRMFLFFVTLSCRYMSPRPCGVMVPLSPSGWREDGFGSRCVCFFFSEVSYLHHQKHRYMRDRQ